MHLHLRKPTTQRPAGQASVLLTSLFRGETWEPGGRWRLRLSEEKNMANVYIEARPKGRARVLKLRTLLSKITQTMSLARSRPKKRELNGLEARVILRWLPAFDT